MSEAEWKLVLGAFLVKSDERTTVKLVRKREACSDERPDPIKARRGSEGA
jgi:hypothetical protein